MKNNDKTVEEVIVTELDNMKRIEAYLLLSDEGRYNWRVFIVKQILSIRRITSWIMTILDICTYALIGSAIFRIVNKKPNDTKYCAIAVAACIFTVIAKRLMDKIEIVYIRKSSAKREKTVMEHFSPK